MLRRTLVKNTLLAFLSEVVPLLVGVVTVPAIINALGPQRFGILSLVWMLLWYFGIFDFGLGRATTKYVSEAIGNGRSETVPELVWTAITAQLVVSMLGMAILAAMTEVMVRDMLKVTLPLVGEVTCTLHIIIFMVPVVMITTTLKGVLEAAQRFDLVAYVKVPTNLSTFVLTLAGVLLGMKLPGITTLLLVARSLTLLAYFLLACRVFTAIPRKVCFKPSTLRTFFFFGSWATVSNTAGPLFGYLERFLITYWLSVESLSYYAAPADMVSRLVLIPMSMSSVLFPAFSTVGVHDKARLIEMFRRPIKYLLVAMTPIMVLLVAFAHPILEMWLSQVFAQKSTLSFQILVVSVFLNSFAMIPYTVVHGLGRPDLKGKLDIVALPAYALLNVWLIPRFGIAGAAYAKLLITVVDLSALICFATWIMKSSVSEICAGKLAGALFLSLSLMMSALLIDLFPKHLYQEMFLMGALVTAFLFAFAKFALDETDLSAIRGALKWGSRSL